MIGMLFQKKWQVEYRRPQLLQPLPESARQSGRRLHQRAVLSIEKLDLVDAEFVQGAPRFAFADRANLRTLEAASRRRSGCGDTALPPIGEEHHGDVRSAGDVPGERSAATDDFIVHVGRHHQDALITGLPDQRGSVENFRRLQQAIGLEIGPRRSGEQFAQPFHDTLHDPFSAAGMNT